MDLSSYPFHQLSQSAEAGSQSLMTGLVVTMRDSRLYYAALP